MQTHVDVRRENTKELGYVLISSLCIYNHETKKEKKKDRNLPDENLVEDGDHGCQCRDLLCTWHGVGCRGQGDLQNPA